MSQDLHGYVEVSRTGGVADLGFRRGLGLLALRLMVADLGL